MAHAKAAVAALVVVASALLPGCAAVGDVSGAVAGIVSGAMTANPAVGIGVGITVRAAATEAAARVSLSRRRNEQEAIAGAIADADVGDSRPWAVDQRVTGDAHGEVRVIRLIETPLATCKEVLFSIEKGDAHLFQERNGVRPLFQRAWFSTTACEEGGRWRWAAAEPAVERWGNLQ